MGLRLLIVAALAACALAGRANAGGPPGATAQCRDGTYSSAVHHSGACSHHGGVATWLDASGATPGSAAPTLGPTIDLRARTRSTRCTLGPAPDRRCSPGAYYGKLTAALLCGAGFRTSSIRNVSESTRHVVEIEYGLAPRSYGHTLEIDHIVPLELGGSNDLANLFPERAPGFHAKDRLENALRARVCSGAMPLRAAQAGISSNWKLLYRVVFGVAP